MFVSTVGSYKPMGVAISYHSAFIMGGLLIPPPVSSPANASVTTHHFLGRASIYL